MKIDYDIYDKIRCHKPYMKIQNPIDEIMYNINILGPMFEGFSLTKEWIEENK